MHVAAVAARDLDGTQLDALGLDARAHDFARLTTEGRAQPHIDAELAEEPRDPETLAARVQMEVGGIVVDLVALAEGLDGDGEER